jgi:N-acetylglucosaminyl-diphospho-decaprenol L-rhamnosyltransferase
MTLEQATLAAQPTRALRLGVVLVVYKSNDVLPRCLASLTIALEQANLATPEVTTVVLVNNDVGEPVDTPNGHVWKQIVINSDSNSGFSPAVNSALPSVADTDYILLLNPDAQLAPDSLRILLDTARTHHAALVGPLLVDDDGHPHGPSERPFHSIRRELARQLLGTGRYGRNYGRRASRDGTARCLTGACLLVDRRFIDDVGGLDTTIHMYLEDVVLCWQAHLVGRPVVLALTARCQHALGGSTKGVNDRTSVALYLTILAARLEFIRRKSGSIGAGAMRLIFVTGACLRCTMGDVGYRRLQRIVIWWALTSGAPPQWHDGPHIAVPAFLAHDRDSTAL